jgi:hypothetical protein
MNQFNPTQYNIQKPEGFDQKCQQLAAALSNLDWLEKSFGRAYLMNERQEEAFIQVPKIYQGKKEYFSAMPNDNLKSFSFIIGSDPETYPETAAPWQKIVNAQKSASLIFFLNYSKIDSTKPYPFSEELKNDVIQILDSISGTTLIDTNIETVQTVYTGFNLRLIDRDLLYFPFGAMRFNLTLNYDIPCQN